MKISPHYGGLIIGIKVLCNLISLLILELVTNLEDARLYLQHSHSETGQSAIDSKNNLTLDSVTHAIQSNNAIDYTERLRTSLNDTVRVSQRFSLENKLLEFNSRFNVISDFVRSRMLQEVDRKMNILTQEEQNIARIQDPSEISGQRRRTFGKGGSRKHTAAEIAENELKKNDRRTRRIEQSSPSGLRIIDLTSSFVALTAIKVFYSHRHCVSGSQHHES